MEHRRLGVAVFVGIVAVVVRAAGAGRTAGVATGETGTAAGRAAAEAAGETPDNGDDEEGGDDDADYGRPPG